MATLRRNYGLEDEGYRWARFGRSLNRDSYSNFGP